MTDAREKVRATAEAESALAEAFARLNIAVAEAKVCAAVFASSVPSHWPEGSAQESEESEDRDGAIHEVREELTRAKGDLALLRCTR